ncbi:MAG: ATP-binding protein, partial [Pseudomonadales bacterium]|nr:ATP-binding protein [Pseudomonadales bacterium]
SELESIVKKGDESVVKAMEHVALWLYKIRYYSAAQYTNPSECPVYLEVDFDSTEEEIRYRRARGLAARFLQSLHECSNENEKAYRNFIDIIGPHGLGLISSLEFKTVSASNVDYSVRVGGQIQERSVEKMLIIPQFKIGNNTLSPNQLSEGTFRMMALVFFLVTEAHSLLLIEEPEVCVHHGLLSSLIEIIKMQAAEGQVVISTHSDFVLDHVEPESVFSVTRNDSGETVVKNLKASMSGKELAALREYLDTEGSLGEYWRDGGFER